MVGTGSIRQQWKRERMAESPTTEQAAPAVPSASRGTFIASGARFEGTLSLRGDFTIDTEFQGEIETDGTITVGPEGSVVGNIRAREVVISGAVVGDVIAPRQLIVKANAKVHGDLETACLEIEKHAFFQGTTRMTQPQASRRPVPDVTCRAPSWPSPIPT